jgi:DNA-binding NarL/FixJ family response regulator
MSDVLLVGSNHVFRQALAIIIDHHLSGCRIRGQVSTCTLARKFLREDRDVDVAIIDVDERLGDPIDVVSQLVRDRPGLAALALLDAPQEEVVSQLCQAGVALVLDKSASLEVVLEGIRQLRQ